MAEVETALFTRAQAHAGLEALIGADAAVRLYPNAAPQAVALPYVVYDRTETARLPTFDGDADMVVARVGMTVYATSRADLLAVAVQLRDCYQDWGSMAASPPVDVVMLVAESDGEYYPELADGAGAFSRDMSWEVVYRE